MQHRLGHLAACTTGSAGGGGAAGVEVSRGDYGNYASREALRIHIRRCTTQGPSPSGVVWAVSCDPLLASLASLACLASRLSHLPTFATACVNHVALSPGTFHPWDRTQRCGVKVTLCSERATWHGWWTGVGRTWASQAIGVLEGALVASASRRFASEVSEGHVGGWSTLARRRRSLCGLSDLPRPARLLSPCVGRVRSHPPPGRRTRR